MAKHVLLLLPDQSDDKMYSELKDVCYYDIDLEYNGSQCQLFI
jgi:hypothetical protein